MGPHAVAERGCDPYAIAWGWSMATGGHGREEGDVNLHQLLTSVRTWRQVKSRQGGSISTYWSMPRVRLMSIACAPYMRRPGGRIINISSIAVFTGSRRAGSISYAAAKSGLIGLTFALARELSQQGITANVIAPGFIANTDFTAGWPEEAVRDIVSRTPVGRPGHVQDVAAAVQFLASDEAAYITGKILHVNGGWVFGY